MCQYYFELSLLLLIIVILIRFFIKKLLNIRYMALHDSLTNLPNRNLFEELFTHALAKAKRHGSMLGVMFVDLDKFKSIK